MVLIIEIVDLFGAELLQVSTRHNPQQAYYLSAGATSKCMQPNFPFEV